MFSACGPFWPWVMSNYTFWFSSRLRKPLDAIAEMGARNVLITLENGCFALMRFGRKTKRLRAFAPHVEHVSGVGSGDVLLAQFLAAVGDERFRADGLRRTRVCARRSDRPNGHDTGRARKNPGARRSNRMARKPRVAPARQKTTQFQQRDRRAEHPLRDRFA